MPRLPHSARIATVASLALLSLPATAAAAQQARPHLSVRSTPTAVSVRQGRTARSQIRTTLVNGSARAVSFRVTNLPEGVTARFTPRAVKPGRSATLILASKRSVHRGRYVLRIAATSRILHRTHRRGHRAPTASAASLSAGTSGRAHSTARIVVSVIAAGQNGGQGQGGQGAGQTGPVPTHIETWSYDDGCNGGTGASSALVRQWLTYAESNCGPNATKAVSDCDAGSVKYCTTVEYLDTNKIYTQESVPIAQAAQENWWLHQPGHTDSAHRLTIPGSDQGNVLNPANPAVQQWFKNYVQNNYNNYDALMMDDTGASLQAELYGTGYTKSDEITSDAQLQQAHDELANSLTHSNGSSFAQINNGIGDNPYLATPWNMVKDTRSVDGLVSEGVPESDGQMPASSWQYPTVLDEMAHVDHTRSDYMVLLSYDQNGSLTSRRVQAATVLLGYSPGHIVSWSDLEQSNDHLSVWPEEGLYPTDPVQTMSDPTGHGCMQGTGQQCPGGGHNDLQVAPGVYRREFRDCYNQGQSVGPCATIVNTTNNAVTIKSSWLTLSLHHQITMDGGDVQSGGTINPTGASFTAGSTTVGGQDAALLSS
jgi:hypothetical protein